MTQPVQDNQAQTQDTAKQAELEKNFTVQRKHYEKQLEQERQARQQAEARAAELEKQRQLARPSQDDDDDDSEPYVDHKKLKRKLANFEATMDEKIEKKAEQKARAMVNQERENSWLKANPDYEEVISHANAMAEKDPEWAEAILAMPPGFERQKLVYKNIKMAGLHKKEEPKASIQDKVDANRRSPYYQPSGMGAAPYASQGDFSPTGQKNAYAKLQELKSKLRI